MTTSHAEEFVRNLKEVHQRRKELWWKLHGDMLYSKAFQAISRDRGPSVAVLMHCLGKQSVPPSQKERKRLRKAGLPLTNAPQPFFFPVREAEHIGLSIKGLWKALERLHAVGFIDRLHAGSAAKKGDYATYQMSDRWKRYGENHFVSIPWAKAKVIGTRDITIMDDNGNITHRGTGLFIKRRLPKTSRKVRVVAANATTRGALVAPNATTNPPVVAANAINRTQSGTELVAVDATVLLNHTSTNSIQAWEQGRKGGGRCNCAPSCRPPLSEIRENVAEILRQRPDPRAGNRRFISLVADQLQATQRSELDVVRVHRDLQDQHDLDPWSVDLLFTIAVIDRPDCGEVSH